ncbi:MAG: phosphatidylglycerophosphatase A [Pirellulales bacterium]
MEDPAASAPDAPLAPWDWSVWLASGLGVGWIPYAPGTFGTLAGLPLIWLVHLLPLWGQGLMVLGVFVVGVPICTRAVRCTGGAKDPGWVVLDEMISLPITFVAVPLVGVSGYTVLIALIGFVLHRVFDILKPPPAMQLERLPEGLGIMADDVAAGIYSCITLHLLLMVIPLLGPGG